MVRGQLSYLNHLQKHNQYYKDYSNEYYKKHKEIIILQNTAQHNKRGGAASNKTICRIIKNHHEAMKDDPEHLTTEFIKKLIKVDCKEV